MSGESVSTGSMLDTKEDIKRIKAVDINGANRIQAFSITRNSPQKQK